MSSEISKASQISAWVISGLLTALFLFSASGKLMHPEQMAQVVLQEHQELAEQQDLQELVVQQVLLELMAQVVQQGLVVHQE